MKRRGIFITLEGIDGAGKTTQYRLLIRHLKRLGHAVCATREPGGTPVGERIRRILVRKGPVRDHRDERDLSPRAELLLMYAARAQLLEEVIRPALARGQIVISDRFNDASRAYQGYGRGLGVETVHSLDRIICGRTRPDLTIILDLDPRLALARARDRQARRNFLLGRFEAQGLKFQERVRAGYLAVSQQEPKRVKVVRADRLVTEIHAEVRGLVDVLLRRRNKGSGD